MSALWHPLFASIACGGLGVDVPYFLAIYRDVRVVQKTKELDSSHAVVSNPLFLEIFGALQLLNLLVFHYRHWVIIAYLIIVVIFLLLMLLSAILSPVCKSPATILV